MYGLSSNLKINFLKNDSSSRMPKFLGIKSYLTTNRSNIRKQDATKIRRSHLSKSETLREDIADRLKCPLCFCLSCFVVVAVMLAFIVVYVTKPYMRGMYCMICYNGKYNTCKYNMDAHTCSVSLQTAKKL